MLELLKIGVVIFGIIVMIRVKVRLSVAITGSALILGLLFHLPWGKLQSAALRALLDLENLKIVSALELVLIFSAVMKDHGSMDRAIAALSGIFRDARITVALIPAVIGLLPVVGGAMLSAPLVASASDSLRLSPERRTFLNFWFRHVWEFTAPTFPAVFLTAGIVGVPVAKLVLINLPLTLACILTGVFFGFRNVQATAVDTSSFTREGVTRNLRAFIGNLLPFFAVIFLTVCFDIHLAYSMAIATTGILLFYQFPPGRFTRIVRKHISIELACLIWGIMVFKEILMETGAMTRIAADLTQMGVSIGVLAVGIPALIAFITGYTTAFVGLSFPVLLPFINLEDGGIYYVMLALASGICAHLLSPMHACYVMTLDYYRADMGKTYRLLLAPAAITLLTAVAVFAIGRWVWV